MSGGKQSSQTLLLQTGIARSDGVNNLTFCQRGLPNQLLPMHALGLASVL